MTTGTAHPTSEHEEPLLTTTELPLPLALEATTSTGRRLAGRLAALLRSEWMKSTTVRTNKVLLALAAITAPLSSWATAAFVTDETVTVTDVFIYPMGLAAVLAAIAGVLSFTAEVEHGTLAGSLTAHPSRWPVVAAKAVIAAGFGLVIGVAGTATGFLVGLAGGLEVGDGSGLVSTALWALLYTSGSALLGLGVGMVVRHSAGAVSGLLVWWLVVEGLVIQFAPAEVVRFLPFDAGFRTLGVETEFDSPEMVASALSNPLYASIFWGYVIAALVVGTVLLVRRDVD